MGNINKKTNQEIEKMLNDEADEVASRYGYKNGVELTQSIKDGLDSLNSKVSSKAARAAGELTSKLAMVLYEQTIYDNLGTSSVYSWVNKFETATLPWGNSRQIGQTVLTGAGNYDANQWVPTSSTNPMYNDTFYIRYYQDNTSTLAHGSYQYKKSLTLQPHKWSYYFQSGKLDELIAKIRQEMLETYELFVAERFQTTIKTLASGTTQTTIVNAGENGKDLRLKTITSSATDSFAALCEFMVPLSDLVDDVNNYTIASDSTNIRPVKETELIIFVPKKLKAKFRSGVLSRLPSSSQFEIDKVFKSGNTFIAGQQLNTVKPETGSNENVAISIMTTPFLDETKIVVLEKDAIIHTFLVKGMEDEYYGENMNTQLIHHMWGNIAVNPFKRGFVFKCDNLLVDPS